MIIFKILGFITCSKDISPNKIPTNIGMFLLPDKVCTSRSLSHLFLHLFLDLLNRDSIVNDNVSLY